MQHILDGLGSTLLKRPSLSGVVCHSGTQPSDLLPPLPRDRAYHLGWGRLRMNRGSRSPRNYLKTAMRIHVFLQASGAKVKKRLPAAPCGCMHTRHWAEGLPLGSVGPFQPVSGRLQMGKLRLREMTSHTQGHTDPKE